MECMELRSMNCELGPICRADGSALFTSGILNKFHFDVLNNYKFINSKIKNSFQNIYYIQQKEFF